MPPTHLPLQAGEGYLTLNRNPNPPTHAGGDAEQEPGQAAAQDAWHDLVHLTLQLLCDRHILKVWAWGG